MKKMIISAACFISYSNLLAQDLTLVCTGLEKQTTWYASNGTTNQEKNKTTKTYAFTEGKFIQYKFCSWNEKRIYCSDCDPALNKESYEFCAKTHGHAYLFIDRISGVAKQLRNHSTLTPMMQTIWEFEGDCQQSSTKKF